LKIALVHDWLTGFRGGERVLDHLARRYPQADLFTLVRSRCEITPAIDALPLRTSPLNAIPGIGRHYRKFLPLFPWAIQRFDFSAYELVISTSHAVAKSVQIPEHVVHLSYCFTPMRYIWDQSDAYLGRGLRRRLAGPLVHALRRFDVATSDPSHVTRFVAISNEVADRIRRHYGREARVVAPPVETRWLEPAIDRGGRPAEDFYLLVGGFVPYKREALAIETFRGLRRRLVIVGDGPTRIALERGAPPNVEFTGRVDPAQLASLYGRARALIYPQREDFGLVAVEAQAAGLPVIAFGAGGVRDTVRPLEADSIRRTSERATGVFFDRAEPAALAEAIERFEKAEPRFDPRTLQRWAQRFSPERFDREFDFEIERCLQRRSAAPRGSGR
jgi:glycosyltransferase involved in cell wall biosynthesis